VFILLSFSIIFRYYYYYSIYNQQLTGKSSLLEVPTHFSEYLIYFVLNFSIYINDCLYLLLLST